MINAQTGSKWILVAAVTLGSGVALAQQGGTDFGKREFEANCASCHGAAGKGDGPFNELLKTRAPDLTTLAKRNNGVFPISRVYTAIDGATAGHGSREMPVWGQDYRVKAAGYYMDVPYDPEAYVRTRILSLVEYVSRLQAK